MAILGEDLVTRIAELIDQKGLKRVDLYKITPSSSLTRWKNGQGPNAYTLYEISKFLGVSIDYLVTGKPPAGLSEDILAIARAAERLSPEGRKVALHQVEALAVDFPCESSVSSKRA
jgi:transcriptional regulator with XRE-family HTH domain